MNTMCIKIFLVFYIATSLNDYKETTKNVQLNTPESRFSEADFMRLAEKHTIKSTHHKVFGAEQNNGMCNSYSTSDIYYHLNVVMPNVFSYRVWKDLQKLESYYRGTKFSIW